MTMANTRILVRRFDYFAPKTIGEALDLLGKYGPAAKIIAGGTDVLVQLKREKIAPDYLIHIMGIQELQSIKEENGLKIGAATRLRDVRQHCLHSPYPCLYEAVSALGKPQIWNMGTIGGNLCNASPAADTAPPLLVLGGRVRLLGPKGERVLDLEDFFEGVNRSAMTLNEIMVEIRVPPVRENGGNAFRKLARVGSDISKVTCAVSVVRDGEVCTSCRIALGAVADVPMRAKEAEEIVQGRVIENALLEQAGAKVSEEVYPIDDVRSTAKYRRQVAGVLFQDVFWEAWRRAGGEKN